MKNITDYIVNESIENITTFSKHSKFDLATMLFEYSNKRHAALFYDEGTQELDIVAFNDWEEYLIGIDMDEEEIKELTAQYSRLKNTESFETDWGFITKLY